MVYINWPDDVNIVILDSTSLTVGDGATVVDDTDGGRKLVRLKTSSCPDTHQVSMDFNWTEKDENGLTEWDRFWLWYKEKRAQAPLSFV